MVQAIVESDENVCEWFMISDEALLIFTPRMSLYFEATHRWRTDTVSRQIYMMVIAHWVLEINSRNSIIHPFKSLSPNLRD